MIVFGLLLVIFGSGTTVGVLIFPIGGFALMGFTYGPLGTLAEPFPVAMRYTGASLFSLAGIAAPVA